VIYTYVAVAIVAGAAAFGTAWKVQQWRFDSAQLATQVNQRATERLRRQNSNTAAVAHEADKIVIQKEFVPITQEVERVVTQIVYRDTVCLPDDGLRVIRGAISRANGDTGEPSDTVPASPPTP
jgi:hypothetical protein